MKKLLRSFVLTCALGFSYMGFGQSAILYLADHYDNNMYAYDTTGGGLPTLISTIPLTGGSSGTISGVYSLALKPSTQEMYCVYDPGSGSTSRRLGVVDTVSGAVTDIGGPGNLQEISFYGEELFGTTGNNAGWQFVRVDQTTGVYTVEYSHPFAGYSSCIFWNDYTGTEFYKLSYGAGSFSSIDTITMTETAIPPTGYSNSSQSAVMLNDSVAMVFGSDYWGHPTQTLNVNTGAFTYLGIVPSGGHAAAFNQAPFYVIVNGPFTFCDNENMTTLASSDPGTSFQWNLDGSPIAGATDSTHIPTESGMYSVTVDGETTNTVNITVLVSPIASFDAVPNPVDLGVDPLGQVDLTNTSTGGNDYHWDFGTGFTSGDENITYPYSTVGDYDVEFIVYDTTNGCSDTAWTTITVINSTGINELSAEFKVYPIPADDVVYVNMSGASGTYAVELIGIDGKQIKATELKASATTVSFDLSDFSPGVYFIKVYNEKEQGAFKVIKH